VSACMSCSTGAVRLLVPRGSETSVGMQLTWLYGWGMNKWSGVYGREPVLFQLLGRPPQRRGAFFLSLVS
jgi:hypothetical protein